MATESPEKERKKPKQPLNARTSLANRDRPLFASRRLPRNEQQRAEFFTESLNTSYIPTPSPTKNVTRRTSVAKPKPAVGSGRNLAAAFRATAKVTDANQSPSPSPSSRRQPRATPPTTRDTPKKSAKRPTPGHAESATPSPSRDRKNSIVSPSSSASSPPRGLAEAYQRIDDEELLAGQEGEYTEELSFMNGDLPLDQHMDMDEKRLQSLKDSGPPISWKASRRESIEKNIELAPEQDMAVEESNSTHDSEHTSSLSFLSDAMDNTFNRSLAKHARDEQRVKDALGEDAQPFRKAGLRHPVGLTVENLQRKDAGSQSRSAILGSPSVSSKGSDPSLNVPQEWARKSRGDNRWLNRIDRNVGKFTGDIPRTQQLQDVTTPERSVRRTSEPIVDWIAAAAEVPLPSVESGSSQTESKSSWPSRASMSALDARRRTSLGQIPEWELNEDEFTARSLQISDSPPIRIRNTALDRIREREIESLEKGAHTTNRLGELKEKRSLEHIRRRSPSIHELTIQGRILEVSETAQNTLTSPTKSPRKPISRENSRSSGREPSISGDADSPPAIPILVLKPDANRSISTSASGEFSIHPPQRPSHERQDSRDLLRKLARVTSASPSPSSSSTRSDRQPKSDNQAKTLRDDEIKSPSVDASLPKPAEHPQKTDITTSEDGQTVKDQSEIGPDQPNVASTPQKQKQKVCLQTPMVTGAWIETPLPTGGRGPPMPTPEILDDKEYLTKGVDAAMVMLGVKDVVQNAATKVTELPSIADTAPVLPKSTLSNIIEKAKTKVKNRSPQPDPSTRDVFQEEIDDTLLLNESTIQSLEELVVPDTDVSALLTPPQSNSLSSPPRESPSNHLVTGSTSNDVDDLQPYIELTSRLSKVGWSIRDAKKGIASLERFVTSDSTTSVLKNSSALTDNNECTEAGEFHDFIWPCERCGCPGSLNIRAITNPIRNFEWQPVRIPVPRLWTWRRGDRLPRLRRMGWWTFLILGLIVGEWIAWDAYTPPFYATSMRGYGVDIDMPRPPFILAKVVWRFLCDTPLRFILYPLWLLVKSLVRVVAGALGVEAGLLSGRHDGAFTGRAANGNWRGPGNVLRENGGNGLGMEADEYI
ncbi:MAG: hypothetical protein Q9187_007641 [Circinaria calcarea]